MDNLKISIAKEISINIKLLLVSVCIGIATYYFLNNYYFTMDGPGGIDVPMYSGFNPSVAFERRNLAATAMSKGYAINVFLITLSGLIIGRYLISGLNWVNKTSKL